MTRPRSPWLRQGIESESNNAKGSIPRRTRRLLVVLVFALLAQPLFAQDEIDTEEVLRAAARRSVAVATILDAPIKKPEQRLGAVFSMLDLGETDVAAALIQPLLATEYDDETRAELVRRFGTAKFLRLAQQDRSLPEDQLSALAGARKFAQDCIEAADKESRDPARIAELVEQLNSPSLSDRQAAQADLSVTGTAGGKACLEALAQETKAERRGNIMQAVVQLRPEVDPLLIAALASGEGLFVRDVAEIAGHTLMLDAAPFLAAIAVRPDSSPEAKRAAQSALTKLGLSRANTKSAQELLLGDISRLEAPNVHQEQRNLDQGVFWLWSQRTGPKTKRNGPGRFSTGELSLQEYRFAALERLAKALVSCDPENEQYRLLEAAYFFEAPSRIHGAVVVSDETFTTEQLSLGLASSIKQGRTNAAVGFASILGRRGDPSVLHSQDGRPTPLAKALQHGNRLVRFAALEAIMEIAPQRSFAGASYVPKALWEFAAAAGTPQAVAASSVAARATQWAGLLRTLGLDAFAATSGRQALKAALRLPRLTLIVIDSDIGRPRIREVVFQLRNGLTTKHVPVAIFSSAYNLQKSLDMGQQDPYLLTIVHPHREGDFEAIVADLEKLNPAPVDEATRLQQTSKALQWIVKLRQEGHPYDEFSRGSDVIASLVYNPELTTASTEALAALGTPRSQQSLIDFASSQSVELEDRRTALSAFATSVKQHGILLTPSQVHQQYDRYNASQYASRDTQQVLGELLDVLEGKPLEPEAP